jgi:hypothetical protein
MSLTSRTIQTAFILSVGILLGRWTVPLSTVSAQAPSLNAGEIMIGTVPVRLGMKKDNVLGTLRKQYKVEDSGKKVKVGGAEIWFVRPADDIRQAVGSVQFRQDRVVDATREWGSIEAEDALVSFFKNIYGALDSASSRTHIAKLRFATSSQPDEILTHLLWTFGDRSVGLYLVEDKLQGKPYRFITVEESVSQP